MTVAVPAAPAANSAVQVPADRVQLAATVPAEGFDEVKLTVPVGVFEEVVVSGTVAIQFDLLPEVIVLGLHVILEDV